MSRQSWKPLYVHPEILSQKDFIKNLENITVVNRATVISKQLVGLELFVYNGVRFFPVTVTSQMLGHRVGEFAPTRKKPISRKAQKKKKK